MVSVSARPPGNLSRAPHFSFRDSAGALLKFPRESSEIARMDKLLTALGLSSDSFWTWVGVIAFGLIVVRIFLDAAAPRRTR